MSVDATLQERGSRYGTIEGNASTTQAMMDVIAQSPRAGELTDCLLYTSPSPRDS